MRLVPSVEEEEKPKLCLGVHNVQIQQEGGSLRALAKNQGCWHLKLRLLSLWDSETGMSVACCGGWNG